MTRQRIRVRQIGLSDLGLRLLVSLLAVAIAFYGVMVVLAALKVDPRTIDHASAYRTVYHHLTSITADQISGRDRLIVAAAGLLCAALFGPVAWRALPRPYLARTGLDTPAAPGSGSTDVAPRAIERIAEVAARHSTNVEDATARYGTATVDLRVRLRNAERLLEELTDIQQRAREGIRAHGLPDTTTIDVTLAGASS